MKALVLAEHDNQALKPATLKTLTAAFELADDVTVLVAGFQCQAVAEQAARLQHVSQVLLADAACYQHFLAENIAPLTAECAEGFDYVLAGATTFAKNCMPRVAAQLDVGQISEIVKVIDHETFIRPIYAGNVLATVKSLDACKVMTVRPTAFSEHPLADTAASIETLNQVFDSGLSEFLEARDSDGERPELSNARIVISGGRGLQNADNFKLLERLADRLNAALGASRAAVDAGFVPNDYQVGQTGKIVAPELYIAVGISGAIQHLAGMKDSRIIVAINKDPDAPIFKVADYGIVGDLFEILPAFEAALDKALR
jgi:electron transfer flavoprotein alpha subunit